MKRIEITVLQISKIFALALINRSNFAKHSSSPMLTKIHLCWVKISLNSIQYGHITNHPPSKVLKFPFMPIEDES